MKEHMSVYENKCSHYWTQPLETVGGCKENPGYWLAGEIMISKDMCSKCGRYRRIEKNIVTGRSKKTFLGPDSASYAWVREWNKR